MLFVFLPEEILRYSCDVLRLKLQKFNNVDVEPEAVGTQEVKEVGKTINGNAYCFRSADIVKMTCVSTAGRELRLTIERKHVRLVFF